MTDDIHVFLKTAKRLRAEYLKELFNSGWETIKKLFCSSPKTYKVTYYTKFREEVGFITVSCVSNNIWACSKADAKKIFIEKMKVKHVIEDKDLFVYETK